MKVGRKKYKQENKKIGTSISISKQNFEKISESKNRSKLIDWLLDEYFASVASVEEEA